VNIFYEDMKLDGLPVTDITGHLKVPKETRYERLTQGLCCLSESSSKTADSIGSCEFAMNYSIILIICFHELMPCKLIAEVGLREISMLLYASLCGLLQST